MNALETEFARLAESLNNGNITDIAENVKTTMTRRGALAFGIYLERNQVPNREALLRELGMEF